MRFTNFCTGSVSVALLASSAMAFGPEWVEQDHGDAGSLPSDAQVVTGTGPVTKIRGTLVGTALGGDPDIADAYLIEISEPTILLASTSPFFGGTADFDTKLWLMTADGFGLLGNDDTQILTIGEGSGNSTLFNQSNDGTKIVIKEPGTYLLCITNTFTDPFSATGAMFSFGFFGEISGPDGPGGEDPVQEWIFFPPGDGFGFGDYEIVLAGFHHIEANQAVNVDIKPGGCPNSFNRTSNGVLPVSVLGSASFDVHDINVSTVTISRADGFGGSLHPHNGPPGPHATYEDNASPYTNGTECGCHELNGDGFVDLALKFKSRDLVEALELDTFAAGALVTLRVSGELNDGTTFSGVDCIRLVPPGTPPGLVNVRTTVAGGWVDMSPLDLQLDGGGFGKFSRTYPQSTVLTLTAPDVAGQRFLGWRINAASGLTPGRTLTHTVAGSIQSVEAVYEAKVSAGGIQAH